MRYASSMWDVLRQESIYQSSQQKGSVTKEAVLAMLRFDALMACDQPHDINDPHIVLSLTDVLDGALLGAMDPDDLKALNLEIALPDPQVHDPVLDAINRWVHHTDGCFLSISDGVVRNEVANCIRRRNDTDISSLSDVQTIFTAIGFQDQGEYLCDRWRRWQTALAPNGRMRSQLAGFRYGPSSAADTLAKIQTTSNMSELGLTDDVGGEILRVVASKIREAQGMRREALYYLRELEASSLSNDERGQFRTAKSVIYLKMFESIAEGNDADCGYSAGIGVGDAGLDQAKLGLLVRGGLDGQPHQLGLPLRLVSGLGKLSANDYREIMKKYAPDVAEGIQKYRSTQGKVLCDLEKALRSISQQLKDGQYLISSDSDHWTRSIIFNPIVVGGVALVLDLIFTSNHPGESAAFASVAAAAAERSGAKLAARAGTTLLADSLVREAHDRLAATHRWGV